MKAPDFQRGNEAKRREFQQHRNDVRPDKPLTKREGERLREVIHEHRKFTER